jgi:hypothetical protein
LQFLLFPEVIALFVFEFVNFIPCLEIGLFNPTERCFFLLFFSITGCQFLANSGNIGFKQSNLVGVSGEGILC